MPCEVAITSDIPQNNTAINDREIS